jgi:hypothetical protein
MVTGTLTALWYAGDAVVFVIVLPVVILILNRVLRPAVEIDRYAADVAEHAGNLVSRLDSLTALEETEQKVGQIDEALRRYAAALEEL